MTLYTALGRTGTSSSSSVLSTLVRNYLHLPLSGVYSDGSVVVFGSDGYFWSSTYGNSSGMYGLYLSTSDVYPQDYVNRVSGVSVRCVTAGS